MDSNHRPSPYQDGALANWANQTILYRAITQSFFFTGHNQAREDSVIALIAVTSAGNPCTSRVFGKPIK